MIEDILDRDGVLEVQPVLVGEALMELRVEYYTPLMVMRDFPKVCNFILHRPFLNNICIHIKLGRGCLHNFVKKYLPQSKTQYFITFVGEVLRHFVMLTVTSI